MAIHPEIQPLLELQEIDKELSRAESSKKGIPSEIDILQERIFERKKKLESTREALRKSEVARKQIDLTIQQIEEKVIKLKTQQLTVKKNEEYEALNRELVLSGEAIDAEEEKGLEILEEMDRLEMELQRLTKEVEEEVQEIEAAISALKKRGEALAVQIESVKEKLNQQSKRVTPSLLEVWNRLHQKKIRLPLVVSGKGKKCGGCHMRISNDLESRLLMGEVEVHCDQCGRLLYAE